MAILRPLIQPTVGIPNVVLLPRGKNLTQEEYYQQQQGNPTDNTITARRQKESEQFDSSPESSSGNYIQQQLQNYANRKAPPLLEPSARVRNTDTTQSEPGQFQGYYDMLNSISDIGNQASAASAARAAYRRQQQMMAAAQSGGGGSVGSNSGGSYVGSVPSNPKENFKFAQQIAPNYGWDANQLAAWYRLGMKESGWNNNAQNPTSTAYGIGQFLNSTWGGYGIPKTSDPRLQVEAMARYIKARYGNPANALAFHNSHNWY